MMIYALYGVFIYLSILFGILYPSKLFQIPLKMQEMLF